jgi:hypothetical protein
LDHTFRRCALRNDRSGRIQSWKFIYRSLGKLLDVSSYLFLVKEKCCTKFRFILSIVYASRLMSMYILISQKLQQRLTI